MAYVTATFTEMEKDGLIIAGEKTALGRGKTRIETLAVAAVDGRRGVQVHAQR